MIDRYKMFDLIYGVLLYFFAIYGCYHSWRIILEYTTRQTIRYLPRIYFWTQRWMGDSGQKKKDISSIENKLNESITIYSQIKNNLLENVDLIENTDLKIRMKKWIGTFDDLIQSTYQRDYTIVKKKLNDMISEFYNIMDDINK